MDAFIQQWGLDTKVVEYLASLEEGVRSTVLAEFAPRGNTHDISGKLYAFARSVESKHTGANQMPVELELFAQKWNLDNAAVAWLVALPPMVFGILAQDFDPKEDTHNVIGKMKGFARSIQARLPAGGGVASPQEVQRFDGLATRLAEFGQHWGADGSALALIQAMPPDVQATVMEQFDPRGEVTNLNGKLCSFARSIAAGRQGQDVVQAFATHWGLDEASRQWLRSLPEDVRRTVLQEFDPDTGTKDVANKLRVFAKGVAAKGGGKGSPLLSAHSAVHRPGAAPPAMRSDFAVAVPGPEASEFGSAAFDNPAIEDFVARWGLDASTASMLESLEEDVRARVLQDFDPRGNTRNVSGKLVAFVRTVISGQGRGSLRAQEQPQAVASDDGGGGGSSSSSRGGPFVDPGSAEAQFLAKWGLAAELRAAEVLQRLQPAVKQRVMHEFAPGQDTRDVVGKFCGFAQSVARSSQAGASHAPLRVGIGPATSFRAPAGLPPLRSPAAVARQAPLGGGFGGRSGSYGGHSRGGALAADQFADRYQLDEGSRALLRGLDPAVQATVIAEFQPRDDVRDPSGKFCAFARSVATRLRGGGGSGGGGGCRGGCGGGSGGAPAFGAAAGQKRPFEWGGSGGGAANASGGFGGGCFEASGPRRRFA